MRLPIPEIRVLLNKSAGIPPAGTQAYITEINSMTYLEISIADAGDRADFNGKIIAQLDRKLENLSAASPGARKSFLFQAFDAARKRFDTANGWMCEGERPKRLVHENARLEDMLSENSAL
ncbi:hypothetical protein [Fulvimarina sp. MAC8]|uniref:hypothetical protein n=1 Tax=Fulvimarina sp. MAC8 TaxID=3162874 RepID=UPI0032EF4E01